MLIPLIFAGAVLAQSPATRPEFEVASIRPSTTCGTRSADGPSPGRLTMSCVSLRHLIRIAYGAFVDGPNLNPRMMDVEGGPSWLDSDQFDIVAKAADNAPVDRMIGPMLQSLLEDRFHVQVHMASHDVPIYALTVAKNGPKLPLMKEGSCVPIDLNNMEKRPEPGQRAPKYCGGGRTQTTGGTMVTDGFGVTMAELCGRMLTNFVDRPVIDRTGLTGRYDIHLEFVRDNLSAGPVRLNGVEVPGPPAASADPSGLSIFTAVQQQLGLKLSPDKGPVDVIVVDHAEKPSEN